MSIKEKISIKFMFVDLLKWMNKCSNSLKTIISFNNFTISCEILPDSIYSMILNTFLLFYWVNFIIITSLKSKRNLIKSERINKIIFSQAKEKEKLIILHQILVLMIEVIFVVFLQIFFTKGSFFLNSIFQFLETLSFISLLNQIHY